MRKYHAFTLVELLVVIGIIAVLVGILLPVMGKARRSALRTATLASLHQIGLAVANYQTDFKGAMPAAQPAEEEGRSFRSLALLAGLYKLPPRLFINPNTADTPADKFNADGWPVLAELDGAEITATVPATIDASNIVRVKWHCSFAYDGDVKPADRRRKSRVYLGDRADYGVGRSFSDAWGGAGMCLLWTDQHADFVETRSLHEQADPNLYHHNEYFDENGLFPGEGGAETHDGIATSPATIDTHLRFFSEEEDDALLPND